MKPTNPTSTTSFSNYDDNGSEDNHQNSRFQVAKVNDENPNDQSNIIPNGSSPQMPLSAQQLSVAHSNNTYYDSNNVKSFRYYTREVLPRADHYRNIMSVHRHVSRPTLDELHFGQTEMNKVS